MTERRYFTVTHKNATYNETQHTWEIDFPHDFYISANPEKKVVILGIYYLSGLNEAGYDNWVSLHSKTLANGKPQEVNNYITLAQYPAPNWTKDYSIRTHEQKFEFEFRFVSTGFNKRAYFDEISDQFIIEMELIY